MGEEVSDVELARRKERRRRMREQKQKWGIWKIFFVDDYYEDGFFDDYYETADEGTEAKVWNMENVDGDFFWWLF